MVIIWIVLLSEVLVPAWLLTNRNFMHRGPYFFAVRVPDDFLKSPVGRRIWRQYGRFIWIGAALALLIGGLIISFWHGDAGVVLACVAAPLIMMVAIGFALNGAHREAKQHAVMPDQESQEPTTIQTTWDAGTIFGMIASYLFLFAALAVTLWHWESLPEQYPIHWNLQGEPDRWQTKSLWSVLQPAVAGWLLLGYLHWIFSIRYRAPKGIMKRMPGSLPLVTMWLTAIIFAVIVVVPAVPSSWMESSAATGIIIGIVVLTNVGGIILIAIAANQASDQEGGDDGTRDEHWTSWGFYRNPDDPALFIAKRVGVGFTINLKHRYAWWFIVGNLLFLLLFPGLFFIG